MKTETKKKWKSRGQQVLSLILTVLVLLLLSYATGCQTSFVVAATSDAFYPNDGEFGDPHLSRGRNGGWGAWGGGKDDGK